MRHYPPPRPERPLVNEDFLLGMLAGTTLVLPIWAAIFILLDWLIG